MCDARALAPMLAVYRQRLRLSPPSGEQLRQRQSRGFLSTLLEWSLPELPCDQWSSPALAGLTGQLRQEDLRNTGTLDTRGPVTPGDKTRSLLGHAEVVCKHCHMTTAARICSILGQAGPHCGIMALPRKACLIQIHCHPIFSPCLVSFRIL
ncbi:hypothetical protein RRG08_019022 [Elysia crispata]|uniref:Uncharacterized protein n=1 Tax=Elysia crispata TaxID=231223 RepID=A0AAE1DSH2_9GAST|nr:hypothetical protein RRG08_019022 [Elysia crispata]